MKLSEVNPGENLIIVISKDNKQLQLEAQVVENHTEETSEIVLNGGFGKMLVFKGVDIAVQYQPGDAVPIEWNTASIRTSEDKYELVARGDGTPHNRRKCFRVGVSAEGVMSRMGKEPQNITVKDVSLSGFAITDKFDVLDLKPNDLVRIEFEEDEIKIKLEGRAVRIDRGEDKTIYGFVITSICNNLSSFIMEKQRKMSKFRRGK